MNLMDCDDISNGSQIHAGLGINDYFPNEILEEIFEKLSQSSLCKARLVCQRWRVIVDEIIGHTVTVTGFSTLKHFLPPEETSKFLRMELGTIKLLNLHGLAVCHLSIGSPEMLTHEDLSDLVTILIKNLECIKLSSPHVLRSVSCFEPICSEIIPSLTHMAKLNLLNLSLFTLSNLHPKKSFKSKLGLNSLKTLIISDTPVYPQFDSSSAIPNLNMLLSSIEAPILHRLDIGYPVKSLIDVEEDSTQHIMDLIRRTSKTLRILSVRVLSPSQNFIPPSKDYIYLSEHLDKMTILGKGLRLTKMELQDNHLHSLRPSLQAKGWAYLMKEQRKITSLKLLLKSSLEFQDVLVMLQNNCHTLINIQLGFFPSSICRDSSDIYFVPIDCQQIQDCTVLERIIVSDKLINTKYLPKFLKYVYVDAILTNEDAHDILCLEREHLERVELKDSRGGTPKGLGYGVRIETLLDFVKSRKIKRLIIYEGSTDGKFPPDGIFNEDFQDMRMLRKLKPPIRNGSMPNSPLNSDSSVRIDWKLNTRGFYECNSAIYGPEENHVESWSPANLSLAQSSSSDNRNHSEEIHHNYYKCEYLFSAFQ